MGPDGQVINVGGTIVPTPRDTTGMIEQVTDANKTARGKVSYGNMRI